jgi:hypothetical protein
MSSPCPIFRDAFLAAVPPERPSAHRETCAACARWARAMEAREGALSGLRRLSAPPELEGAVVAALEAGFRQERAVDALLGLGRVASPRALDHALQGELGALESPPASLTAARRLSAPEVLAELVSEELADPAGHRVRRFVGSLERLSAPAELAERLAAQDWSRPVRRPARLAGLGVLGLLLASLGIGFALRDEPPSRPTYDFVVERVDDPAQLSGLGTGLLDGLSGGRLSAGRP